MAGIRSSRADGPTTMAVMADDLILDDPIIPDHKDWTWVLQRPCSECGVDVSVVDRDEIADLLRCTARDRVQILAGDPTELRRRGSRPSRRRAVTAE